MKPTINSASNQGIKTRKMGLNHFKCLRTLNMEGKTIWNSTVLVLLTRGLHYADKLIADIWNFLFHAYCN